jgi:hypothetical protein
MRRLNGGWGYVGLFVVLFDFSVPFVLLLSRPFKRDILQSERNQHPDDSESLSRVRKGRCA